MQISDYLYAIRRRLWLPIVAPVVAALVTAGVLYIQPEHYQATATVIVPALSARGYSTSAVTQYFSTFKDVLVSTPVVNEVANQTGEKPSNLLTGLSANVVTASSNIIQVTYIGPNKKTVTNVAQVAAQDALDILMQPQLSAATNALTVAQQTLTDSDAKRSDYESASGHPDPVDEFKFKSQALSAFEVQLQQAQLARLTNHAKFLQQVIDQRQQDLLTLAPIVDQWRQLDQAVRAAEAAVDHAQIVLNNVNGEIASNHDPQTVTVKNDGHVSRLPTMLRFGGVAFGVALLLALGFIVAMEFFRPAVAQVPYLRRLATPRPRIEPALEAVASANGSSEHAAEVLSTADQAHEAAPEMAQAADSDGGYSAEVLSTADEADEADEAAPEMPVAADFDGGYSAEVLSTADEADEADEAAPAMPVAADSGGRYSAEALPTADEVLEPAPDMPPAADSVAEPVGAPLEAASMAGDSEVVVAGAFPGSAGAFEDGKRNRSPRPGARKTRS